MRGGSIYIHVRYLTYVTWDGAANLQGRCCYQHQGMYQRHKYDGTD